MKRIIIIVAAGLLTFGFGAANAQEGANSMAELLRLIQQGQARDSQEARQREANFATRNGILIVGLSSSRTYSVSR